MKETQEAVSIRFEALEFLTEIQLTQRENSAEKQRLAKEGEERERLDREELRIRKRQAELAVELVRTCQAIRVKIGNKTLGSLTVNEADLRDKCRLAGAW